MSKENSTVGRLVSELRDGDEEAARVLWEQYFARVVNVARNKLPGGVRREFDEEDVAISALHSLCRGVRRGSFPELSEDGLWPLLLLITTRKAGERLRMRHTKKRGGGTARGESVFGAAADGDSGGLHLLVGEEPSPELVAELMDESERLLGLLDDPELRELALLKMEGRSNPEIAKLLNCTTRTVERRLALTPADSGPRKFRGSDPMSSSPDGLPLQDALLIDSICVRFERARLSRDAGIEEFLEEVEPHLRSCLLAELLAIDIELRTRGGDRPRLSDYAERFPPEFALVRRVLEGGASFLGGEESTDADRDERDGGGAQEIALDSSGQSAPKIGGYELIRKIGQGGQGLVYLARDPRLNRQVALKVLAEGFATGPMSRMRFEREAEVASRLDHPGICTIFEAGHDQGVAFIAMQLVQGMPLDEAIRIAASSDSGWRALCRAVDGPELDSDRSKNPSSAATQRREVLAICRFVEKAARALHCAHEAGLVHRDIKPGNIMIDLERQPVILDFGLARDEVGSGPTLTQSGDLVGTPAYMSPEQVSGRRLDRRSDVFSLGVTLYECLTLQRPFEGETRAALFEAILRDPQADPRQVNPALPRDLCVVLETALEKAPNHRYASASEFADELDRVWNRRPIHARPVGPVVKALRSAQRNPVITSLVGALIVFLSVATGILYWKNQEVLSESSRKDDALLKEQFANAERNAALMRYEQMSDVALLDEFLEQEVRLWPSGPHQAPAMADWLAGTRELLGRGAAHAEAIAEIQQSARPYTRADEETDLNERRRKSPELQQEFDDLETRFAQSRERLAAASSEEVREDLESRIEDIEDEQRVLRGKPGYRLTWRFDDPRVRWRHQVLSELAEGLDRLRGLVGRLERRHQIASTLHDVSIVGAATEWESCARSLASDVRFGGFVLRPQIGLVPLGRDRHSKLWEFWHVASGSRPTWTGEVEAGSVMSGDADGIVMVLVPPGTFTMGAQRASRSEPNYDPQAQVGEGPPHRVQVAAFFVSKFEVTQGQWLRSFGSNPSHYAPPRNPGGVAMTPKHPVERISWIQADAAAKRWSLSLPTEAQWE